MGECDIEDIIWGAVTGGMTGIIWRLLTGGPYMERFVGDSPGGIDTGAPTTMPCGIMCDVVAGLCRDWRGIADGAKCGGCLILDRNCG